MMNPITALMAAAITDAPNLTRSDASARGAVTTCQNFSGPSSADRRNVADSGISTTSEAYVSVKPIVRPKPGRTRKLLRARGSGSAELTRMSASIDLIERAVVVKVFLLRLLPAAEGVVDGHQFDRGKLTGKLLG